jgi:hypothetical protein
MWYEYYRKIQRSVVVCGISITVKYNEETNTPTIDAVVCGINITGKYNFSLAKSFRTPVVCGISITVKYNENNLN